MEIFVPKYRNQQRGRIRHDRRIERYWKHKKTGSTIEVQRYLCIDNREMRVVVIDPLIGLETSMSEAQLRKDYEAVGNTSAKF